MSSGRALRVYAYIRTHTHTTFTQLDNEWPSAYASDICISVRYHTGLPATRDSYAASVAIRDTRQHSGRKPLADYCVSDGVDSAGTSRSPQSLDARALRSFPLACTHGALSLSLVLMRLSLFPLYPHLYRHLVRAHTYACSSIHICGGRRSDVSLLFLYYLLSFQTIDL